MTTNEQQQIGALIAEVANLKATVDKIDTKVDSMETKLAAAEGGWKMAIGIGTIAGAIMGYASQFLPFLKHP